MLRHCFRPLLTGRALGVSEPGTAGLLFVAMLGFFAIQQRRIHAVERRRSRSG